jgi:hypothetical protein
LNKGTPNIIGKTALVGTTITKFFFLRKILKKEVLKNYLFFLNCLSDISLPMLLILLKMGGALYDAKGTLFYFIASFKGHLQYLAYGYKIRCSGNRPSD